MKVETSPEIEIEVEEAVPLNNMEEAIEMESIEENAETKVEVSHPETVF